MSSLRFLFLFLVCFPFVFQWNSWTAKMPTVKWNCLLIRSLSPFQVFSRILRVFEDRFFSKRTNGLSFQSPTILWQKVCTLMSLIILLCTTWMCHRATCFSVQESFGNRTRPWNIQAMTRTGWHYREIEHGLLFDGPKSTFIHWRIQRSLRPLFFSSRRPYKVVVVTLSRKPYWLPWVAFSLPIETITIVVVLC